MQIFHPGTNSLSRVSLVLLVVLPAVVSALLLLLGRSPYVTGRNLVLDQPVPFSHAHHAGALGIDCRYCHTSVETTAFAGIPPTETCMQCHSQVWSDTPVLEPVRASFRDGRPLRWRRVHDLPDFVYFDHSVHVAAGVSCRRCHGRVDRMPLVRQTEDLTMSWCLDCHREPERFVGPPERVFDVDPGGWSSGSDLDPDPDPGSGRGSHAGAVAASTSTDARAAASTSSDSGAAIVERLDLHPRTSCSACHR